MIDRVHEKAQSALLLLRRAARQFAPAALSNGLGAEGMVLTDLIFTNRLPVEVFPRGLGREGCLGLHWEKPESKECGLHVRAEGRLAREKELA